MIWPCLYAVYEIKASNNLGFFVVVDIFAGFW